MDKMIQNWELLRNISWENRPVVCELVTVEGADVRMGVHYWPLSQFVNV